MAEASKESRVKKILVASDLSPRAEKALARTLSVAAAQGAMLSTLHVMEDQWEDEDQAATIEETLHHTLQRLSPAYDGPVTLRVVAGKPFVEIIRRAREEAADLIVVGAHGANFIKDLFFGTTAEKVIRKGERPVLVVKQTPQGPYQRVLVAVDFSKDSRRALELALRLAPQAEFSVLHTYAGFDGQLRRGGVTEAEIARLRRQWAKEARQELETFLRDVNCGNTSVKRILKYGRASHVITQMAKRLRADLVAVGTTGRTGLPYILLGNVAEHVLREVPCDVLVARAEALRFELP
jgi:nucleotide-binding universal stress UspA family protein